ncbi:SPOR domain-containing protein [Thalassotalea maritima]|uniref:SPOR domain-containing protein n=1 Tax=Thalassotalea maritima TaxID=3242416 RepID=UPI00352959EF
MDYINKTSGKRPRRYDQPDNSKQQSSLYKKYGIIAGGCLCLIISIIAISSQSDSTVTDEVVVDDIATEQVATRQQEIDGQAQTKVAQETTSNTVKVSKQQQAELPALPEPDFVYPDLLTKNKDIDIDAYDVPDPTPYRLRCGAFRQYSDALRLANKVSPVFNMSVVQSGNWYIVRSGYLGSKRDAQNMNNKIKRNVRVFDCLLQKQPKSAN